MNFWLIKDGEAYLILYQARKFKQQIIKQMHYKSVIRRTFPIRLFL